MGEGGSVPLTLPQLPSCFPTPLFLNAALSLPAFAPPPLVSWLSVVSQTPEKDKIEYKGYKGKFNANWKVEKGRMKDKRMNLPLTKALSFFLLLGWKTPCLHPASHHLYFLFLFTKWLCHPFLLRLIWKRKDGREVNRYMYLKKRKRKKLLPSEKERGSFIG